VLVLTGDTRSRKIVAVLRELGWGRIWIDQIPTPYPGERWGFDNGAFRDWTNGRAFDETAFWHHLNRAYQVGNPHMAIVPDLVTQGEKSLDFSLSWLPRLPVDWPWYLAVQDGMRISDVELLLPQFAGLFLGGSSRFKGTAYYWCELAHKHGRLFHYGRAGIKRKVLHAIEVGADSADSAFPLWTVERLDELRRVFAMPLPHMMWGVEETSLHPDTFL